MVEDVNQAGVSQDTLNDWIKGDITLQELRGITDEEMAAVASLGYTFYENGKLEEAKVIFEGLEAWNPNDGYTYSMLGAIYLLQNENEKAINALNEAIRLDPNNISAYVNRGEVLLKEGKLIEAAEDLKKAIELDKDEKDPSAMRARALVLATRDILKEAVKQKKASESV
jgi:tetratricopeptide (TPR) repeat protein